MFVFTHHGSPVTPHNLWSAWNIEAAIFIPLAFTALIYLWGMQNVWQRAGTGHGINRRHYVSFLGALLVLLIAFVSPLDAMSAVLFSAHMVQHMLLVLVAAPLLVLSDFPLAFLWVLPRPWAQSLGYRFKQSKTLSRIWRVIRSPVFAWLLFTIALWVWHASTLYEAALEDEAVHTVEHLAFLMTAMLFWWVLLKPAELKHRHYGMAIPYLFGTILQSGILGALMTFTDQPWYPSYAALVPSWNLTPLQDQQLAGLIMWVPGGAIFTLLTIGYFALWLRALEQRSIQLQRRSARRAHQELKSPVRVDQE
jgi:putative membrane protein